MSGLIERADKELKNAKTQEKGLLELMARKEELLEELAEIDKQINELQAKRPINN
jgi:predicted signal transduction protein with EAL and GGDEF domain